MMELKRFAARTVAAVGICPARSYEGPSPLRVMAPLQMKQQIPGDQQAPARAHCARGRDPTSGLAAGVIPAKSFYAFAVGASQTIGAPFLQARVSAIHQSGILLPTKRPRAGISCQSPIGDGSLLPASELRGIFLVLEHFELFLMQRTLGL